MRFARFIAGCGLLAAVAVLSTDGSVLSQEKKEGKLKGQLPSGWTKLELTAAQKESVYKIDAEYKDKITKLEDEIKSLRAEQTKKRIGVLTEEQKKKLAEMVTGETPKEKPKDKK